MDSKAKPRLDHTQSGCALTALAFPCRNMRAMPILLRSLLAGLLTLACLPWSRHLAAESLDDFPRPQGLQSAFNFWTRIYAEFDVASGLIHDSRDLSIIYSPLYLNPGAPLTSQKRTIEEIIGHYRAALLSLADGKRADLNVFEQRALEPWRKRGAKPEDLREAAERVRFQRGQVDRLREGLERARRWQSRIEAILREQGLPLGLAALPHVESSYNPNAVSKVGAAGLWQFMPATARRYIRVDDEIDERFDVIKSTQAAANLLHQNYSVLQHWPLALTAYNHGLSGVRRAVRETGSPDIARIVAEYQGPRFGFASRNFYVAFVAAHDLVQDPERNLRAIDPADALELTAPAYLPARVLADFLGISPQDFRAVNPEMHHDIWNGAQLIPRGARLRLPPSIDAELAKSQLARFVTRYGFDGQVPLTHYDLNYGESLSGVAVRLGTSVRQLVEMNGLEDAHQVKTGQRLRVPPRAPPTPLGPGAAILLADLLALQSLPVDEPATMPPQDMAPSPHLPDLSPSGVPAESLSATLPTEALADLVTAEPALIETQPDLAADPTDYGVAGDGSIEIQVAETLGHYAKWLNMDANKLRALNALGDDKPLMIGQRLRLDFSQVTTAEFEQQRLAFHRNRQLDYFARYRITSVDEHLVREGQTLWDIAVQTYRIPLWLLRQFNPDVGANSVLPLDRPLYVPTVEVRPPPEYPLDTPLMQTPLTAAESN